VHAANEKRIIIIILQYRLLCAYIYGKIKYYYSFNVNNLANTCQLLLINYPAVRRRHRTRPYVVYSIPYYYYYHYTYTIICIQSDTRDHVYTSEYNGRILVCHCAFPSVKPRGDNII